MRMAYCLQLEQERDSVEVQVCQYQSSLTRMQKRRDRRKGIQPMVGVCRVAKESRSLIFVSTYILVKPKTQNLILQ